MERNATIADLAKALGVTDRTVQLRIRDGVIPANTLGRLKRVNIEEGTEAYNSWRNGSGHGGNRKGSGRKGGEKPTTGRGDAQTAVLIRKCKLYDIQIAKEMGELVDAAEVKRVYTRAVTAASRTMNGIGKTAAARVVAELAIPSDSIPVIDRIIREECIRVINLLKAGKYGGPEDG